VPDDRQPRRQLHGYVSNAARDGWYDFSERHGTNVSALLEAIGVLLGENRDKKTSALPAVLRSAVKDAQAVASSRSSRRR
jgi:hypothetical protein